MQCLSVYVDSKLLRRPGREKLLHSVKTPSGPGVPPSCTTVSLKKKKKKKKKEENTDLQTLATWWRRSGGEVQQEEVSEGMRDHRWEKQAECARPWPASRRGNARKQIQDKCQAILGQLLREEDNKYCVDCDAKGPRWASWNLGMFLCIRCAGIHRNLGVHISRVKSVNLDTWTPEQVACLQQMGNSKGRAVYEANLPDNFRRPQTDSSLEAFIRSKYEQKKYIAKEWVQPPMPPPAFDIEEDRKKDKDKKRPKAKASSSEVPGLAGAKVALPRPSASGQAVPTVVPASASSQHTADLLGLGTDHDHLSASRF
ncbi:hypothetical protein HPB47_023530 [Ixodes persulcatus]|uniref:Uncharacterized protein n=1 Tax=Ixodes persulcatus TaxID=34615 RepID=A0AC60Q6R4_IXOPE|nr:hypothetical protein HPB47_023530 [Ixodes persulcatus]